MNLPIPNLLAHQVALQDWLMHGNAALSGCIDGDRRDQRMRIYGDAYRLRLTDILANDFPVLHALVGEDMFDALAGGYLHAHPSRHPSVRHFGCDFPDWLRQQEHPSTWSMLADFEWAQGEAFDAVDAAAIALTDIAALPADAWPGLRLTLHPAIRRVHAPDCIPEIVEAHHAGRPLPSMKDCDPSDWLLWRADFRVHWRRLDADEAMLLDMVAGSATFADLCAQLSTQTPETTAALRVVSLLKLWITDGLVIAAAPSPNTIA
ncbi:MAG: putative DNA-binding domain-containing protein [Proteobacteria bacterium]|nr:putative DNA-binding domain-containing protein [Pseudomonadota bacterium]